MPKASKLRAFTILFALSLVWGSSFILIKKSLVAFSNIEVACLRLGISAIAFTPLVLFKFVKIDWSRWKTYLLVGLTGSGIPAFMYSTAQTQISSTMSGVLNSLTPICTLIIGVLVFKANTTMRKLLGVAIGFLGAAMLFVVGQNTGDSANIWYGLFVVVGTICYGFSANIVQYKLKGVSPLSLSAASFFMIGIPALSYVLFSNVAHTVTTHEYGWQSLGAVTFLSLAGTVLASIWYYHLVQITDAVFSSSVAYLMPIVAIGWGAVDGEHITIFDLLGMALILVGVYLIKKKKK